MSDLIVAMKEIDQQKRGGALEFFNSLPMGIQELVLTKMMLSYVEPQSSDAFIVYIQRSKTYVKPEAFIDLIRYVRGAAPGRIGLKEAKELICEEVNELQVKPVSLEGARDIQAYIYGNCGGLFEVIVKNMPFNS